MSSRVISPGDLAPGMHITVLDNIEPESTYAQSSVREIIVSSGHGERDWRGVPLKVLAVDLPFVLFLLPNGNGKNHIDTRRHTLMEVKADYWKAVADPENGDSHFDQLVNAHRALAGFVHGQLTPSMQAIEEKLRTQTPPAAPPSSPPTPPAPQPRFRWLAPLFKRG